MHLPSDRIRFALLRARLTFAHNAESRSQELSRLMADALTDARRMSGAATEGDLENRYGFTRDEIVAHRARAIDIATQRFVRGGVPDPATC